MLLVITIISTAVCTVEGRYQFSHPNHRRRLGFWTGSHYTPKYSELFGGPNYSPKYDQADRRRLGFWTGSHYTPKYNELFGGPNYGPSYDQADDYDLDEYENGNLVGSGMRRLGSFCNGAKCFYTNPALKRECDYGYAGTYWSYYSKSQCL